MNQKNVATTVRSTIDGHLEGTVAAVLLLVAAVPLVFALRNDPPAAPVLDDVRIGPPSGGPEVAAPVIVVPDTPPEDQLLPPSSCLTDEAGTVTCTEPAPGVESVVIRTYPSRVDVYAAYVRDVEAVSGDTFVGNVGDCSGSQHEGELSWALDRTKSRDFPLRLLRDDRVEPASAAAGRVFCTRSGDQQTIVWTQHPFRVVTVVGDSSELVGKWWVDAHIALACDEETGDCPVAG